MQYVDSSLSTKGRLVSDQLRFRDGIPVFSIVEFNIWGSCNRRCPFCPVSNPEVYTERREGIELDNYKKILTDLESISFDGMILWSMFSEPLLHKNILDLATATKTALPSVRLQIVSGSSYNILMNFSCPMNCICISIYSCLIIWIIYPIFIIHSPSPLHTMFISKSFNCIYSWDPHQIHIICF